MRLALGALCATLAVTMPSGAQQQPQGQAAQRPATNGQQSKCVEDGNCDPRATAERALNEVMPLTPELVEELRKRYLATGRAAAGVDRPATYVTPLSQRINMGFGAGGAVPIVHTEANYPTTLAFFDQTGKEWPIAYVTNSNPDQAPSGGQTGGNRSVCGNAGPIDNRIGGFQACILQEGSNAIHVTTRGSFPMGGLSVYLLRAPRPLSFQLRAGTGQYMADGMIHVAGRGPNAVLGVAVRADSVETGGKHLSDMLDGITPAGAVELGISGGAADNFRAWSLNNKVYLRTQNASLISPQWDASSTGPDSTAIYSVPEQPYGKTILVVTDGTKNFSIVASRRPGAMASGGR